MSRTREGGREKREREIEAGGSKGENLLTSLCFRFSIKHRQIQRTCT